MLRFRDCKLYIALLKKFKKCMSITSPSPGRNARFTAYTSAERYNIIKLIRAISYYASNYASLSAEKKYLANIINIMTSGAQKKAYGEEK